jgi:phosphate transporter
MSINLCVFKDDFEQFAWTIVFLAMGGIALGKGVTSSGLMVTMDGVIHRLLEGLSLYTVVLVLSPVVLVRGPFLVFVLYSIMFKIVSTFISHTIASVLLVPIAKEVGQSLPGDHANLLIFMTGLLCSVGMGMPVSGFPNQTAYVCRMVTVS